jgi:hypothetical protein
MKSKIGWTQTNRGVTAFIHKNQKYRKQCLNKDGSEISMLVNIFSSRTHTHIHPPYTSNKYLVTTINYDKSFLKPRFDFH